MTIRETTSACLLDSADHPTLIELVATTEFDAWLQALDETARTLIKRQGFAAKAATFAWLPGDGQDGRYVVGWNGKTDLACLGGLPLSLPEGDYALQSEVAELAVLGWATGAYQFTRYREATRAPARLVVPEGLDASRLRNLAESVALTRDLINTAAADMTPDDLAAEVNALAEGFEGECQVTRGDELLDIDCGAIHAVGRAADAPPCLIDLSWGDESHPKITLVGKGVTFDSGGLDIKPAAGMRLMKKDMGGAAAAIGLAHLVMAEKLPVRLRLLVPAAENAISGNAFRPGDVLATHKGLTVEIDNTDAEGRLLLCDALSIACTEQPEVLADFATLTGSARSAVGAEVAAMFCNNDNLAAEVATAGTEVDDAVWRMPLHQDYRYMLDSKVADLVNSAATPYAGAITAALFLERFVTCDAWLHFDIMAFNTRNRGGRPEGGEAMALRAVYQVLEQRYGAV